MLEHTHTAKNGQSGSYQVPESWKELKEIAGDKQAFQDALRGYTIRKQASIRGAGKESKRALTKEAIEKLKTLDPALIEEAGLTDVLAKL